ncbi:MAG: EF2563 family selenium-dependent molybdenum hydroxylase system protein [Candidatus Latescibacterota bacterium]|nr:MAG: EF2563 family selenium-dependent molybdenum hydroxylase system protein [Candidatus Latescibacterota bacterium]
MRGAKKPRVILIGGGDLGTGCAHRLFSAGFPVAIVERSTPLAVRRRAAFSEAARQGRTVVQGVTCTRLDLEAMASAKWPQNSIPLLTAPAASVLESVACDVLVDARVAKEKLELRPPPGVFFVALGPGYVAGRDCDAVVETWRGPQLGRVIWSGSATPDTRAPGNVGGETSARVLRAPEPGKLEVMVAIGRRVRRGELVARVGASEVRAAVDGVMRGMLASGDPVRRGQKLGDVDPRDEPPAVDRISDKAERVAAGVVAAVCTRFELGCD